MIIPSFQLLWLHESGGLEPKIPKLHPFTSSLVCLLIAIKNCGRQVEIEAKNIQITSPDML